MSNNPTVSERSIVALLNQRKEEGWSVDARVILFSEWIAHSLYVIENDKFPNSIPLSVRTHAKVAKGMRELLWNAQESDFVGTEDEKYLFVSTMKNTMCEMVEDASEIQLIKDLLATQFDQSYNPQYLMDILSGSIPEKWETLADMEMDEEDLEQYIASKLPQAHVGTQENNLNRATQVEALKQQMIDCDIPAMFFDALTFESASTLRGINSSLEKTKKAYQAIDAPTVCAGKFFVSFCQPYAEGYSGYMQNNFHENRYLVSLSNQCGWDYSEVLTHEILHAHDALLGEHILGQGAVHLLSDSKGRAAKTPIYKAWVDLDHKISSMQKNGGLAETKKMCREGIGKRWSLMGLSSKDVEQAVVAWEQSSQPEKDKDFLITIEGLFSNTPFKESADFRAKVVLAECKLLDTMTPDAVFTDFVKQFDGLTDLGERGTYGKGYFEDLAEKMARSMQLTLDEVEKRNPNLVSTGMQEELSSGNSFEKRWLVYPEQRHASTITQYWQEFYNQDVIKEAYKIVLKETNVLEQDAESVDVSPLNKQKLMQFKKEHQNAQPSSTHQRAGIKA